MPSRSEYILLIRVGLTCRASTIIGLPSIRRLSHKRVSPLIVTLALSFSAMILEQKNKLVLMMAPLKDGLRSLKRFFSNEIARASTNKKMKETVALELSFVNSNLQLLKEQLAELNSSVELYQMQNNSEVDVPMIPLGLKETKEIELRDSFKDFILEHYRFAE